VRKGERAGSEPAEAQDAGLEIARDRNAIPRVQSLLIATLATEHSTRLEVPSVGEAGLFPSRTLPRSVAGEARARRSVSPMNTRRMWV